MAAASGSASDQVGAAHRPRRRIGPPRPIAGLALVLAAFLAPGAVRTARAGDLQVRVVEAATGGPIGGAFVQVGPAPDDPFPSNWGATDAAGRIAFSHPRLVGPQTATVAAVAFERQTVIGLVGDSVVFRLRPEIAPARLPGPRAEIVGTVTGIQTLPHDGKLDVGIVYPAIGLSDILQNRSLPFEVPADTARFPIVGDVVVPANLVIPGQTEGRSFVFSKSRYRLYVPAGRPCDLVVLAGRLPLAAIRGGDLPLNAMVTREVGVARGVPVEGDRALDLRSDLLLQNGLWVQVPEAPDGSEVFVSTVADLPGAGGARTIFFDAKSARAETVSTLLLSGLMPSGGLADATPYLAGYYADSSSADVFQAGRVDRTPLTLPATRTLGDFFRVPLLSQEGDDWCWTEVARAGVTPEPTWAISTIRIGPAPGGSGVAARSLWEIWTPARALSFRLPVLAAGAPGGIPDPSQTPGEDLLFWDCWIADPSGPLAEVMRDPFATLTRWSRSTIPVVPPAVAADLAGFGTLRPPLRFRLAPNPGAGPRDIFLDSALPPGLLLSWSIMSPAGRRLARGSFRSQESSRHAGVVRLPSELPTGVYWVRVEAGNRSGTAPLVVIR